MTSNLYATLADFKAFVTARGQTVTTDAADDGVIVDLLEQASRFLDDQIGSHVFYPYYQARLYDATPDRYIRIGADLLELTTFTNGDGSVIALTNYLFEDANNTPYFAVKIRDTSSIVWVANTYNSFQQALSLYGVYGWHTNYAHAWKQIGTLGAAITDTTTLAFTMTAGHTISAGQILKIGSEFMNVNTVATNTITPNFRGDNGSTAATHLINVPVYAWQAEKLASMSVLETAHYAYERRFGKSADNTATVTAAGVVLSPRDIPTMAQKFIKSFIA